MSNGKSSLAKGLDAILQLNTQSNNEENPLTQIHNIIYLNIEKIHPNKQQPRKNFDEKSINDLAKSIAAQGILQPIIVRKSINNSYEIIAGERRWCAAKLINLKNIPVMVREVDNLTAAAFSLIENIQRENLNPIEEAIALQKLILEYNLTHDKIAEILGKSRPAISNTLRLLELDELVQTFVQEKKMSMGHARALIGLSVNLQLKIANLIIENQLTVRQTERLVNKYKNTYNIKAKAQVVSSISEEEIKVWKRELAKKIYANVDIRVKSNGKGRVVIDLDSIEDIQWFIHNVYLISKRSVDQIQI